jgi:hypothetical protein
VATVCESPSATYAPHGTEQATGLPTAAGIACDDYEQNAADTMQKETVGKTDWNGRAHPFISNTGRGTLQTPRGCFLSPDGSRMACIGNDTTGAICLILTLDGGTQTLGLRCEAIGWIDSTHLLLQLGDGALSMENLLSHHLISIPAPLAGYSMEGTVPSSL